MCNRANTGWREEADVNSALAAATSRMVRRILRDLHPSVLNCRVSIRPGVSVQHGAFAGPAMNTVTVPRPTGWPAFSVVSLAIDWHMMTGNSPAFSSPFLHSSLADRFLATDC